jgi:replicative DNA helicase Mcm
LKPLVDKVLEVELDKSNLKRFQNAKTNLAGEIINILGKRPIEEKRFKEELIKTGKFSKQEAEVFLKKAISQGMIFEGGEGYYARN